MKQAINSILVALLYILGIGDFGLGVYHSFDKHGKLDGIIGVAFFPYAMYRGIEFWWHDDYSEVDWDKRLKNDMRTCIYFINEGNNNEGNQFQLNEDIEKFSLKIKDYPSDKKQYLMNGTRKYIQYSLLLVSDLKNSIVYRNPNDDFSFIESDKTLKIEKELLDYNLKEEIDVFKIYINALDAKMKEDLSSFHDTDTQKVRPEIENNFKSLTDKYLIDSKRIFKDIFDEEL